MIVFSRILPVIGLILELEFDLCVPHFDVRYEIWDETDVCFCLSCDFPACLLPAQRYCPASACYFTPPSLSISLSVPSITIRVGHFGSAACLVRRDSKDSVTRRRCPRASNRHAAARQRKGPWAPTTSGLYQNAHAAPSFQYVAVWPAESELAKTKRLTICLGPGVQRSWKER